MESKTTTNIFSFLQTKGSAAIGGNSKVSGGQGKNTKYTHTHKKSKIQALNIEPDNAVYKSAVKKTKNKNNDKRKLAKGLTFVRK